MAGFLAQSHTLAHGPNTANLQNAPRSAPAITNSGKPTDRKLIIAWFKKYDEIRRNAQLSPKDKEEANALLSKGLAIIIPGDDKTQTQKLLKDLVSRYGAAEEQLKLLPLYPETGKLHRGYYQYFNNARILFGDYMAVQNNVLAKDKFGNPLAQTLMFRKKNLETLEKNNKGFDSFLRKQFKIPSYSYKADKKKK